MEGGIGICSIVPFLCKAVSGSEDTLDPTQAGEYLGGRVQLILSLVFVGIILIAVFVIVRAGVLYIQSQGDESKIETAQKAIRNVFIGIAVMFVGILGIVLVLSFFGASDLLNTGGEGGDGCTLNADGSVTCNN